jgi:hypothetical protein
MSSNVDKTMMIAISFMIGMIALLFGLFFIGNCIINYYNCKNYQAESTVETVSTLTKCYVKTDAGLIELDRYQLELIYRNRK